MWSSELPTQCRKFRPYTTVWTKFKNKYEIAKTICIKTSPIRRRATCKWSCALEQLKRVDRVKLSSRSTRTSKNKQSNDTMNLFPKFTPTKDATSPLRSSQRAGLPYNSFSSPNPPLRRNEFSLALVQKGRGNTNFSGCSHTRGRSTGDAEPSRSKLEE